MTDFYSVANNTVLLIILLIILIVKKRKYRELNIFPMIYSFKI